MRRITQHELQHSRPNLPEDDAGDDSNGFDHFGKSCECDSPKFIIHTLVFHRYYGCGGVGPRRKKEGKTNHFFFRAGFMRNKMNLELLYLSPTRKKNLSALGKRHGGGGEKGDVTHKGPGSRSSGRVSSIVVAINIPNPGFLFSIL